MKPNTPPGARKKRVRLKPESRADLIKRLRNPKLTLHEASILLGVCRTTVRRYSEQKGLKYTTTPGGHRRFYLRDVEEFWKRLEAEKANRL